MDDPDDPPLPAEVADIEIGLPLAHPNSAETHETATAKTATGLA